MTGTSYLDHKSYLATFADFDLRLLALSLLT
jgi:hypothetical protein